MSDKRYVYIIEFEPAVMQSEDMVCFKSKSAKELIHCCECTYCGSSNWCVKMRRFTTDDGFCHLAQKEGNEDE